MVLFKSIRVVMLANFVLGVEMKVKPESFLEYAEICRNVTNTPYFNRSMVVKKSWTVYYGWNIRLSAACPEFTFKYPNEIIIKRVYKAMSGALETQPPWHDAVLVMIIRPSREMLLFDDPNGIPGRFLGVPNMKEEELSNMSQNRVKVPFFEMAMKLTHNQRYLISSDCRMGVTTLAVRKERRPTRVEIDTVASGFNFGDGFPACIKGPDREE